MKKYLFILSILLTYNCSGYWSSSSPRDNQTQILATTDGGYLSLKDSDEICPYLYRDASGTSPILLFSSDRDGDFDIFYSIMNTQGVFTPPVKLTNVINTPGTNETFPILFYESSTVSAYLTFLSEANGNYEIRSYSLDILSNTLSLKSQLLTITLTQTCTGISLYQDHSFDYIYLSVYNGGPTYYHMDRMDGDWSEVSIYPVTPPFSQNIYAGYAEYYSVALFNGSFGLYQCRVGSRDQLYLDAHLSNSITNLITDSFYIEEYQSDYNDITPFIDTQDPDQLGKVYFSSSREGDYDLYRYNLDTLSSILEYYPLGAYITNLVF